MFLLTPEHIHRVADSRAIYKRGETLFQTGALRCLEHQQPANNFMYEVDGNFGDYQVEVEWDKTLRTACNCPYPNAGCKHVVAVLLDLLDRKERQQQPSVDITADTDFLSPEEIRQQALEDRRRRADKETFIVTVGDMLKGDHLLETTKGQQYQVTLHDPEADIGHCSCPDFLGNRLGTCKHLLHLGTHVLKNKGFRKQLAREHFPYIDIFWDGAAGRPRLFHEQTAKLEDDLRELLAQLFDQQGLFRDDNLLAFLPHLERLEKHKLIRLQEPLLHKLDEAALDHELLEAEAAASNLPDLTPLLKVQPYAYQEAGIRFCLYKKSALIGDEMGLGKTMQAIVLGLLKKELFGFNKILIITLASLKQQWLREIENFTHEQGCIIAGSARERRNGYQDESSLFKISNYEAVLRDVMIISRYKPDLIILDEAQRIKNFATKTAEAIKSLPRQHALVLTGTPLENKLEDVYSIIQFLDPDLLSPLWQFAADHFLLSRNKKGKILGYRNLDKLHQKLQSLVIRRRKEEVLDQLPDVVRNDYFIDLHHKQAEIHLGLTQSLLPLLNKKFLTPMDLRRIQVLLLKMRQVCDSTHLLDRETHISPKLIELNGILDELVLRNNRKVVIFSEWTTMTALIGMQLSRAGIPFVELTGKIPVHKRQALIDEFTNNPACKVFLSTDAGGTGLNLQAADSVINFELPWNPARLNQRIGRIHRIGQKARCINVVNLICKQSIEEKILAGIKLKGELFDSVFAGGQDIVMFDRAKRQELVNQLREMLGEEPAPVIPESIPSREIPAETPHFLNPEILAVEDAEDDAADFLGEEREVETAVMAADQPQDHSLPRERQSPEQMEEVLNQGMTFIGSLLEMATGKKLESTAATGKMVTIDQETGEVTLKFKLPGL
ncbi:DEAD/DEAH box helicase [Desulfobulbus alkaliphilus]|uniref:DEAD/DEAH box helicase n=1 Tax=Desulfobulbus alkaliphilus TaxID=869814 RepID=UPI001966B47E|nr:DEAD/DEAH box helicase [Desulfobulbus alkaliphilus]MBM9537625.1 DEAD/DEAH box helicase [Desulfobulbus alkaliphilus]